ncbi:MAG TPA: hypothetical protein VLW84_05595 [Terriglobales bacterium]|nr:hypothetical protein [Terriglobales bacterium]
MHSHSAGSNSTTKVTLAIVLAFALAATGCAARWLSAALADLPVLTQMALNIAALVATLESGKQLSAAESAAIQNLSAEADKDLTLLQTLYNQYKANPDSSTLQKIESVIGDINQNLPALLLAAHISDLTLSARITAAVNLILTTVNSFAQLIPQNSPPVAAARAAGAKLKIPEAKDLKNQWNQQVCAPSKNSALNGAVEMCVLR